jgi:hypothetical protein
MVKPEDLLGICRKASDELSGNQICRGPCLIYNHDEYRLGQLHM